SSARRWQHGGFPPLVATPPPRTSSNPATRPRASPRPRRHPPPCLPRTSPGTRAPHGSRSPRHALAQHAPTPTRRLRGHPGAALAGRQTQPAGPPAEAGRRGARRTSERPLPASPQAPSSPPPEVGIVTPKGGLAPISMGPELSAPATVG